MSEPEHMRLATKLTGLHVPNTGWIDLHRKNLLLCLSRAPMQRALFRSSCHVHERYCTEEGVENRVGRKSPVF